jgi:hypothetical protein
MATKVSVEVRTITQRKGANGDFWSLNIADSGAEGCARLPEAQFRSYTISSTEGWTKFQAEIEKALKAFNAKACLYKKVDANGADYWSTKAKDGKHVPCVIIVDIELREGDSMAPQYDSKLKAMTLNVKGILKTKTVTIRAPRPGNSVE